MSIIRVQDKYKIKIFKIKINQKYKYLNYRMAQVTLYTR